MVCIRNGPEHIKYDSNKLENVSKFGGTSQTLTYFLQEILLLKAATSFSNKQYRLKNYFIYNIVLYIYRYNKYLGGGGDSSVGKSSASQTGDPGSNHGGGLTWVTQCMNERGRDYQL